MASPTPSEGATVIHGISDDALHEVFELTWTSSVAGSAESNDHAFSDNDNVGGGRTSPG